MAQMGNRQAAMKEKTNHSQGRGADAATRKIAGPAAGSSGKSNPTKSGGINRPTKG